MFIFIRLPLSAFQTRISKLKYTKYVRSRGAAKALIYSWFRGWGGAEGKEMD